MKSLIISLALILINSEIQAQYEYSFENWSSDDRPLPFSNKTPDGWTTSNALTEFIQQGVLPTNDSYSGKKAALIQSLNVFGNNLSSSMTLGKAKVNFINRTINYNGDGLKIDNKSVQLSYWYKYASNFPNSYGLIELHHYSYNNKVRKLENLITDTLKHTNTYTNVKAKYDITTLGSNDTLVIVFKSDEVRTENLNLGQLWVDDVVLEFINNNLDVELSNKILNIWPNPISKSGKLMVDCGIILSNKNYNLYDISGRLVTFGKLDDEGMIDFSEINIKAGIFFLRMSNEASTMHKIVLLE